MPRIVWQKLCKSRVTKYRGAALQFRRTPEDGSIPRCSRKDTELPTTKKAPARTAAKPAAKTAAKPAAKKVAAKPAARTAAKPAARTAAKPAAKPAARKTAAR